MQETADVSAPTQSPPPNSDGSWPTAVNPLMLVTALVVEALRHE
jgi:hypothetical protein